MNPVATRWLWPALLLCLTACGSKQSDQPPPLFPGVPSFELIAEDFPVEALFGPIPAASFSKLSYLQDIESPEHPVPVEHLFELAIRQGSRAGMLRMRSEYTFADSNRHAVEESVQVADLFDLLTYAYTPETDTAPETITRSYVAEVAQVTGALFPLAVGNRLQFEATRHYQVERAGQRSEAQTLEFAYDLRVDRQVAPGNYTGVELQHPVWVIQVLEVDPDGVEHRREAHFSTEVGMPVFDARRRDRTMTTRRLVRWERDA
ncbi:MAG: hypothetical protein VX549_08630 [Pseudomonadota bacterium]|nr:hypothetical protein [Pseudomonadota bacterium]